MTVTTRMHMERAESLFQQGLDLLGGRLTGVGEAALAAEVQVLRAAQACFAGASAAAAMAASRAGVITARATMAATASSGGAVRSSGRR